MTIASGVQVTYLMSGPAHLPYLVCSVRTLRQSGWQGKVEVHCWPESEELTRKISQDDRLGIEAVPRSPRYRRTDGIGANAQFLDKIDMSRHLDCEVSVYLDADTTIHGDIQPLVDETRKFGFVATQWNDWTTDRGHANRRVKDLLKVEGIPRTSIERVCGSVWPSLNGGVWAVSPQDTPVLDTWYNWTLLCKSMFIADERVLHLMMDRYGDRMTVLCGGEWNCSPKYQPVGLSDENVIIRHYHGDSNVRPTTKSQKGYDLWWPIYQECLQSNVGGMADWRGQVTNKYLDKLEREPNAASP